MTLLTLTNYSTLIDVALEANYIEEKDVTLLQEWKKILKTGANNRCTKDGSCRLIFSVIFSNQI